MVLVGWLLIAGFVVFLTGAAGWRLEYQKPREESLPAMHEERGRVRWVHWWMISGLIITVSGLGGFAGASSEASISVAAFGFSIGAAPWLFALLFRISVGEWAGASTVETGSVPSVFPPLSRWAEVGHGVHMVTAYLASVPLGIGASTAGLIPDWLGWVGSVWGFVFAVLFLIPATRVVAAPPIQAHIFTLAVGVALLV